MSIEFSCHGCGQRLKVGDDRAGGRAKCPKCGQVVNIPDPRANEPLTAVEVSDRVADVIDYEIFGNEMQYVEITLDPDENLFTGGLIDSIAGTATAAVPYTSSAPSIDNARFLMLPDSLQSPPHKVF